MKIFFKMSIIVGQKYDSKALAVINTIELRGFECADHFNYTF